MRILVENGRLLDPSRELDVQESLWIEDGIICEKQAFSANQADRVIDAAGGWVVPGSIFMFTSVIRDLNIRKLLKRDAWQQHMAVIQLYALCQTQSLQLIAPRW